MEDSNIQNTLDMLNAQDLTSIERIVLASTDTVQSLMSVIFSTPVRVEVISQINYHKTMIRWVKLVIDNPDPVTVALAESVIPIEHNRTELIGAMIEQEIGIGQEISKLGVFTRRRILGIHVDDNTISRTYTITGASLDMVITELFQREILDVK